MRLQSVVLPDAEGFPPATLCYRIQGDGGTAPDSLRCREIISFDTYYGALSAKKWRQYTFVESFSLHIRASGDLRVRILAVSGAEVAECVRTELSFGEVGESALSIPDTDSELIYFSIEALSDRAALLDAWYEGNNEPMRAIKIALNICTYKREAYVEDTVKMLNEGIWKKENSLLKGALRAIIVDNGRSLQMGEFPAEVRLIPNQNVGGSGGFGRGMKEALDAPDEYTHVVMMDDDIRLIPEALERLYALLCLRRDEYKSHPVAGAMLRLDESEGMRIQHEQCGRWVNTRTESVKGERDLGAFENVLDNEREEAADYAAWWFCCVPTDVIREKGLPYNFFIRYDDVEYGLRIGQRPITLNGVCVWHEPFERKYNAVLEYYAARNGLFVNGLHRPNFDRRAKRRWLWHLFFGNIFRYRYDAFELILRGFEDYEKGAEYLDSIDSEALHKALNEYVAKPYPVSYDINAATKSAAIKDTRLTKFVGMMTLNGLIFPLKGTAIVPAYKNAVAAHYRKKDVLNYIEKTNLGFVLCCDRKRALRLAVRCLKVGRRIR